MLMHGGSPMIYIACPSGFSYHFFQVVGDLSKNADTLPLYSIYHLAVYHLHRLVKWPRSQLCRHQ